jgi:hypothetical protein
VVYYSVISLSKEVERKQCDVLAEATVNFLNTDHVLGGLVYTSWVQRIRNGQMRLNNSMAVSSNITWVGKSKTPIV